MMPPTDDIAAARPAHAATGAGPDGDGSLAGLVFTAGALHLHYLHCGNLRQVTDAGGEYILTVKGNQPGLEVARLRTAARRAGLTDITAAGNHIRFAPVELPESRQVRVQRLYPKTVLKPTVRTMLVPAPKTASIGGQPLRDTELLAWCGEIIRSVLADLPVGVGPG